MTLADLTKRLRASKGLSLAQVAEKAGGHITRATIWKVENGYLPRGTTLGHLAAGLGLKPGSPAYVELVALWTNARIRKGNFSPQELAGTMAGQILDNDDENLGFWEKISALDPETFDELKKALDRPEVMAALASLNRVWER